MQCENDTCDMYDSDTFSDARASRSGDYSMHANLRPSDTGGMLLTRVSQSLNFSVQNVMAWKKQTENEKSARMYR